MEHLSCAQGGYHGNFSGYSWAKLYTEPTEVEQTQVILIHLFSGFRFCSTFSPGLMLCVKTALETATSKDRSKGSSSDIQSVTSQDSCQHRGSRCWGWRRQPCTSNCPNNSCLQQRIQLAIAGEAVEGAGYRDKVLHKPPVVGSLGSPLHQPFEGCRSVAQSERHLVKLPQSLPDRKSSFLCWALGHPLLPVTPMEVRQGEPTGPQYVV